MKIPKKVKVLRVPLSFRVHPDIIVDLKKIMKENHMTLSEVAEYFLVSGMVKYDEAQPRKK